jgi:pantothenate kinase
VTPRPRLRRSPHELDGTFPQLVERARRLAVTGERRILGITGAPGSGKSTLAAALVEALAPAALLVSMDGFHLANQELRRLRRRDRKGAADTSDANGYVRAVATGDRDRSR